LLLLLHLNVVLSDMHASCVYCKQVSGEGPLAGSYTLVRSLEPACSDGCAYRDESGQEFCFETLGNDLYNSSSCPCVPCGPRCLSGHEAELYEECGTECQVVGLPCEGQCREGTFLCGEVCTDESERRSWRDCGGVCLAWDVPCNGECGDGLLACQNGTVCLSSEPGEVTQCQGDCQGPWMPCEGACPEDRMLCGETCLSLDDPWHYSCEGTCLAIDLPCNGSCMPGRLPCNSSCVLHSPDWWQCDGVCQASSLPCSSSCPPGLLLQDNQCLPPEQLCTSPEQECQGDGDCQEGAGCLLAGSSMVCQCYLGYTHTLATTSGGGWGQGECPRTGLCTLVQPLDQATCGSMVEEGTWPCYSTTLSPTNVTAATRVSVCPMCSARVGEEHLAYIKSTTISEGPTMANQTMEDRMVFEGSSCSLVASWACWESWHQEGASLAATRLEANIDVATCRGEVLLLTPLACPAARPLA